MQINCKIAAEANEAKAKGIQFPEIIELESKATIADAKMTTADAATTTADASATTADNAAQLPAPTPEKTKETQAKLAVIADTAPNYQASSIEGQCCGTCRFMVNGMCQAYEFPCDQASVCDAWEAAPVVPGDTAGRKAMNPQTPDGEPAIDAPGSDFNDRGARGVD